MVQFLIENNIPHFVAKYYEYCGISDHRNWRYELFILHNETVKKTWYKEPFYPKLKYRKIKGNDVEFFKLNSEKYNVVLNNKFGKIFILKGMNFDYKLARSVI